MDRRHSPALATTNEGDTEEGSVTQILRTIREGERFLVCSHSRPDGDAVGSMLAMGMLLRQMGKRADLVSADRIPAVYRELPGAEEIRTAMRVHGPYDAAILLECDSLERTRLHGLEKFLVVNIDHHASGVELPEDRIRVSLRGKGKINVAAVAERLGGGGHENASGCTLAGPLAQAREQILAQLRSALGGLADGPGRQLGRELV